MANFVSQHGGQFGFGIQVGEDAAGDVDVSTRQGEGVHHLAVEYGEVVIKLGPVADASDALTDFIDIGGKFRVIVGRHLLDNLLVIHLTQVDFVAL